MIIKALERNKTGKGDKQSLRVIETNFKFKQSGQEIQEHSRQRDQQDKGEKVPGVFKETASKQPSMTRVGITRRLEGDEVTEVALWAIGRIFAFILSKTGSQWRD